MTAPHSVETVVVGGGQAGLVMSALLSEAGREHLVLEARATLGGGWQDRWDAFQLVSPNWTVGVPGLPYDGPDPDGFMTRDELVAWFRRYAEVTGAPVERDTTVTRLRSLDGAAGAGAAGAGAGGRGAEGRGAARFELQTSQGTFRARDVVVATGPFQNPHLPPVSRDLPPDILQLHSHHYRNPADLPPGRVLLIGSGQTGVQLAEELQEAGREVLLSVGRCGHVPRRYRGRDLFWWLRMLGTHGRELGVTIPTLADLAGPAARLACNPQLSGHGGGHTVTLRGLAAGGVRLLGRFGGVDGTVARFAPDLNENARFADGFFDMRFRERFDTYADRVGGDFPPPDPTPEPVGPTELPETEVLDLAAEGVTSVLWTSGYRPALDWLELPVLDDFALPIQVDGRAEVPGLWFIGTPWLVDLGSANLIGLVRDAEALATALVGRAREGKVRR